MWKYLCPKQYVEDVHGIDLQELKEKGIKGIILDLDNTLVPWNDKAVFPEVKEWIQQVKEAGFSTCIVSNNNLRRGGEFSEILEIPAFWKAVKPRRRAFRKALKLMGLKPSQAAVIGDQVFTDILGGNRLGLHTILVRPLNQREFLGTMCVRKVEKAVLSSLKRKGYLK
ncbi:MAG: YqeG family HAD IIIA-type phosphatase [Dethiobacter sp.]|jgi:HAD superfamily phosphatase (TIGR01668 family)|nr:MAG: YqeG family HAD IIIA-type phosphatase [Dethiobacter sp.]